MPFLPLFSPVVVAVVGGLAEGLVAIARLRTSDSRRQYESDFVQLRRRRISFRVMQTSTRATAAPATV
jgi:hypothetical protein